MELLPTWVEHQLRHKVTRCLSSIKKGEHQTNKKLGWGFFLFCLPSGGVVYTRHLVPGVCVWNVQISTSGVTCGRWFFRTLYQTLTEASGAQTESPSPGRDRGPNTTPATLVVLPTFVPYMFGFGLKKLYHGNDCIQNECNKVSAFAEQRLCIESLEKCSRFSRPSGELVEKGIKYFPKVSFTVDIQVQNVAQGLQGDHSSHRISDHCWEWCCACFVRD